MSEFTIDVNQDGIINESDDLNQDGVTDFQDQREFVELQSQGIEDPEDEARRKALAYLKQYGVSQDYQLPLRELRLSSTKTDSPSVLTDQNILIDPFGLPRKYDVSGKPISQQGLYDITIDAARLLESYSYEIRKQLTNVLYAKGFYKGSKPSSTRMDLDTDVKAVGRLLTLANQTGRTWDVTYDFILNNLATVHGVTKIGKVTPLQNREKALDTAAVDILGRKLVDEQLSMGAEKIAQRERSGDKTTLSVMAEKAVSQINPNLEKANRFAKGVDIFRSLLGSD